VTLILFATLLLATAMYGSVPLVTDVAQLPRSTGYGFGASVTVAGLLLVPFAVLSASMSRLAVLLAKRVGDERVVLLGAAIITAALALLAATNGSLLIAFVAMGGVGIGFGFTFAAIPGLIVRAVPPSETGSALGFYQVIRFVGFSVGSAVAGTILAAHTASGALVPHRAGFTVAFAVGAAVCLAAAAVSELSARTA
jgi:MFS family permease